MDDKSALLRTLYQLYVKEQLSRVIFEEKENIDLPSSLSENLDLMEDGLKFNIKFNPEIYTPYVPVKIDSLQIFLKQIDIYYLKYHTLKPNIERIIAYLDDQAIFAKIIDSRDNLSLTSYSEDKFPAPSEQEITVLQNKLRVVTPFSQAERLYSHDSVVDIFTRVFKELDIDLELRISSKSKAKMSINPSKGIVTIREGVQLSANDIKRLMVHEIGVHYQRYLNGLAQNDPFLSQGMSMDYLYYEEGLAVYMEEFYGLLDDKTYNKYVLRSIASSLSTKYDFSDLYSYLRNFLNPEDSFDMVARVKRYSSAGESSGGFTKDVVYFQGYEIVKSMIEENPINLRYLFAGKVSPSDFHLITFLADNYEQYINSLLETLERNL